MQTETIDISTINSDPANVRKHGSRNLESIRASLKRFGQQKPIVVDSDLICRAGNGTLEAARSLGWTTIAVVHSDLNGSEATAYAIADNRTAELAEWDQDALAEQLSSIQIHDADLANITGFTDDEISTMALRFEPTNDTDRLDETNEKRCPNCGEVI